MKTKLIVLPLLALGLILVSGCTTAQPTASTPPNDPRQGASIDKRSYTQAELQKRGGPTLADSLEKQDASVRISGGAR